MHGVIEFHGRLSRSDKRPANPGRYDMLFQLHPTEESNASLWSETVRGIEVAAGGFYHVLLGEKNTLEAQLFDKSVRWLSVRVIASGRRSEEHSLRVPLTGQALAASESLAQLEERTATLEAVVGVDGGREAGVGLSRLREWVEELRQRVLAEDSESASSALQRQVADIKGRLDALDADGGRLDKVEDELEDLVGPDGDVVDLNERMDLIEGQAPALIAGLREREGEAGQARLERLEGSMRALEAMASVASTRVEELRGRLVELSTSPASAEAIGAVKRTGDVMSGGLIINRGGLEVQSGGITCRGASVTTLDASNLVKSPKLIADALELRGDLTVDNTRRVLQVRQIEGRQGSARRDGALHLNTRGGSEVVVGNADERRGLEVFGPISADALIVAATAIAAPFDDPDALNPGEVACVDDDAGRARRSTSAADPRVIGVAAKDPALLLGGAVSAGRVAIALYGVVACRAEADSAPIRPGDALIASSVPGHARAVGDSSPPAGAILGKALEGLETGRGTIRVLLGGR